MGVSRGLVDSECDDEEGVWATVRSCGRTCGGSFFAKINATESFLNGSRYLEDRDPFGADTNSSKKFDTLFRISTRHVR